MRNHVRLAIAVLGVTSLLSMGSAAHSAESSLLDTVRFGDAASESSHGVNPGNSATFKGLLDTPARQLQPLTPASWEGGRLSFTLKVDPDKPNYLTVRFSGDDVTDTRLLIYVDGKQVGYRHLGEIDQLDFGSSEPAYAGRFYYTTTPLPQNLTKGKSSLSIEIRSSGRIWGYGSTFEQYQKEMNTPSRGIYAAYTHTDGCFAPPTTEIQGHAPETAPVRQSPGIEVLEQIKQRVNRELDGRLKSKEPSSQMQLSLLAKAYDVKWTIAHNNPAAINQLIKGLDALFVAYRANPKLAQAEPSTWNPDWFGLGVCGQIIMLRHAELAPYLDQTIDDGKGQKITRRAAFTEMLIECRDWHRKNRRLYTNQTMLNDLNGIYFANRGIAALTPEKALNEEEAKRYLYESIGLIPWTDSDPGGRQWNVGKGYLQLTDKGLTKELGYVGTYGEVIDLVADIYEATKPSHAGEGDPKIKAQLIKIARAREAFRHPALDGEGNRSMRIEQIVGWRDSKYPGELAYGQRPTRDGSSLQAAAITKDPHLVGYAQQLIADNQFFFSEAYAMKDTAQPLRTTIGRLASIDQYELIKTLPPSPHRLPMSWDQPDFVFADEENGVVAIKNGNEILYASVYWRARHGINNLARIHHLTPAYDRVAVVRQTSEFTPSGMSYTRPNWTNFGFANGGLRYPGTFDSAHAGEVLPIAKIPDGIPFKPGQESPYAGRADFYLCRYGKYLIAVNASTTKTFSIPATPHAKAKELTNHGKPVSLDQPLPVPPRSTRVLFTSEETGL